MDPRVIPLGTKLYIESPNGSWTYGESVAGDTGGAIKGNKIDLFFQGKYSVIVKNLKKEMAEAAENEQFEKAAVLRDQITSIEEIMEKQFVDLVDDDLDQDVIAIAPNDNEVVVIIMPIRNGKIVGRDDFLMSGSQYESNSEILFAFIILIVMLLFKNSYVFTEKKLMILNCLKSG